MQGEERESLGVMEKELGITRKSVWGEEEGKDNRRGRVGVRE